VITVLDIVRFVRRMPPPLAGLGQGRWGDGAVRRVVEDLAPTETVLVAGEPVQVARPFERGEARKAAFANGAEPLPAQSFSVERPW
jgi:hypothetical protein